VLDLLGTWLASAACHGEAGSSQEHPTRSSDNRRSLGTIHGAARDSRPAQVAAEDCSKEAHDFGLRKVKVFVKGPGGGRESAIRSIHNSGIEVTEIVDVTPMPHNGCRPPKRRRV